MSVYNEKVKYRNAQALECLFLTFLWAMSKFISAKMLPEKKIIVMFAEIFP